MKIEKGSRGAKLYVKQKEKSKTVVKLRREEVDKVRYWMRSDCQDLCLE